MNTSPLRPQSAGELLDQAVRLYRRHFVQFVGVFAIPLIPIIALQTLGSLASTLPLASTFSDPNAPFSPLLPLASLFGFFAQTTSALLTGVLLQGVAVPALVCAIGQAWLGQPVTILGAYRQLRARWVDLLITLVLSFAIAAIVGFWILVPCVGWVTGFGMSMFYAWAVSQFITPILIFEKLTAVDLFRRAWDLARRRFWWMLGFAALIYIFLLAVLGGPITLLMTAFLGSLPSFIENNDPTWLYASQAIAPAITSTITNLIYYPLFTIAMTLAYVDLRVRTEGLDLAFLTARLNGETTAAVMAHTPARPAGRFITPREWLNFALLSLIPLSLIACWFLFLFLAIFLGGS